MEESMSKHAILILADGFEEMEAVAPIDLLRRAGIKVTVIGLNQKLVRSSRDLYVQADATLTQLTDLPDALILPGGPGTANLRESGAVIELVQKCFHAKKICAAICAAPTVLAKAGILKGKKVTCFPGQENAMQGAILEDADVVVDGTIITARAAGASMKFGLEIISGMIGIEYAEKVRKAIYLGLQ